jgi:hypothetical protein
MQVHLSLHSTWCTQNASTLVTPQHMMHTECKHTCHSTAHDAHRMQAHLTPHWRVKEFCIPKYIILRFLYIKPILVHNFSCMFISIIYMFQATMCPSSGELTVSIWHCHSVWMTIWPEGQAVIQIVWQCHIDTFNSLDDGHIVARNM